MLDTSLKLKLNGKRLYPSKKIKYLGILLDEHLNWDYQSGELIKWLNRANCMLSKVRHYVNPQILRTIYFSVFNAHLNYCNQIWGQNGNIHLNKIISAQNSALRIINFKPFRYNSSQLYTLSNVTPIDKSVKIANLMFVFDFFSGSTA